VHGGAADVLRRLLRRPSAAGRRARSRPPAAGCTGSGTARRAARAGHDGSARRRDRAATAPGSRSVRGLGRARCRRAGRRRSPVDRRVAYAARAGRLRVPGRRTGLRTNRGCTAARRRGGFRLLDDVLGRPADLRPCGLAEPLRTWPRRGVPGRAGARSDRGSARDGRDAPRTRLWSRRSRAHDAAGTPPDARGRRRAERGPRRGGASPGGGARRDGPLRGGVQ
jgi:hypothetical protein